MMSGKTSAVVSIVNNSVYANLNAIVIKHITDDRSTKTKRLCTHDGYEVLPNVEHYYESSLVKTDLTSDKFKKYDIIAIDEGHFFNETPTQLREFAWEARKLGSK